MIALPGPVLALRGVGAVTAVGHSAAQTTASFIARARRLRRRSIDVLADPVTIADCSAVTRDLTGAARLQALLPSAVIEALEGFAPPAAPPPSPDAPTALEILVVPPWLDDEGRRSMEDTLSTVTLAAPPWRAQAPLRACLSAGATGAWDALDLAYRAVRETPSLRAVLIAAVDSLCEPAVLRRAAEDGHLHHRGNAEGFVAGEAAACVLLVRAPDVTALPAGQIALHRPARAKAPGAFWPSPDAPDPAVLSYVLEHALSAAGMTGAHVAQLASDMDGSSWRARLEATALGRGSLVDLAPGPHLRPAELLGQVGAPSGLLGWILPVVADARGIERASTVLGWGVDPAGICGAAVLERSPH